ncbi:hypothetical protein [Actinomadura hibisca]|uniref:hypothetical protein n=1 Tax=Actinomadura hibisca TaxID=68565 RepID=UPI000829EAFD|nr:hypothetical protein [Actinomadura hibisca]
MSREDLSPEQLQHEIKRLRDKVAVYEDQIDSLYAGVKAREQQIDLLKNSASYRVERLVVQAGRRLGGRLTALR